MTNSYRFKLGMFLNELRLPFDESLEAAKDIGAEYVWFSRVPGEPEVADMSDAAIDRVAEKVAEHGLELLLISATNPFKQVHLTDIDAGSPGSNEEYASDLRELVRSMEIAARLGVGSVLSYTFAWPGEYTAEKPTWPMRWMTRGGVISDVDMNKLEAAFAPVVEAAEKHGVDVVLSMMPWNHTNTSGNFRRIAERIGVAADTGHVGPGGHDELRRERCRLRRIRECQAVPAQPPHQGPARERRPQPGLRTTSPSARATWTSLPCCGTCATTGSTPCCPSRPTSGRPATRRSRRCASTTGTYGRS